MKLGKGQKMTFNGEAGFYYFDACAGIECFKLMLGQLNQQHVYFYKYTWI